MKDWKQFNEKVYNNDLIPFQMYTYSESSDVGEYPESFILFIKYIDNDDFPYHIIKFEYGMVTFSAWHKNREAFFSMKEMNMNLIEYLEENPKYIPLLFSEIERRKKFSSQPDVKTVIKYLDQFDYLKDSDELGLL